MPIKKLAPGGRVRGAARQPGVVKLDHIDRPRLVAAGGGVDEDRGLVPVGQVIGEVHAADPVVGDPDPLGQLLGGQPACDLDPESVVAKEDIADPGDQQAARHSLTCRRSMAASVSSHRML